MMTAYVCNVSPSQQPSYYEPAMNYEVQYGEGLGEGLPLPTMHFGPKPQEPVSHNRRHGALEQGDANDGAGLGEGLPLPKMDFSNKGSRNANRR